MRKNLSMSPIGSLSTGAEVEEGRLSEHFPASSRPRSRHAHWQRLGDHAQLFIVNGSRVYDVDAELIDHLERASLVGDDAVSHLLDTLGLDSPAMIDDTPLASPPLRALSLAVAQKCNLGCTYC